MEVVRLLEFQVSSVENWNTSRNTNSMDNKIAFWHV